MEVNARRSDIQAVLFERPDWTLTAARRWLQAHRLTAGPVDTTARYHRFRQHPPGAFVRHRMLTLKTDPTIRAVIGFRARARRNPALAVVSNPPPAGRLFGTDVYEIRYRHADNGRDYKHVFERRGTQLVALPDGSVRVYHPRHSITGEF